MNKQTALTLLSVFSVFTSSQTLADSTPKSWGMYRHR